MIPRHIVVNEHSKRSTDIPGKTEPPFSICPCQKPLARTKTDHEKPALQTTAGSACLKTDERCSNPDIFQRFAAARYIWQFAPNATSSRFLSGQYPSQPPNAQSSHPRFRQSGGSSPYSSRHLSPLVLLE